MHIYVCVCVCVFKGNMLVNLIIFYRIKHKRREKRKKSEVLECKRTELTSINVLISKTLLKAFLYITGL